jgi:hypothetical protein
MRLNASLLLCPDKKNDNLLADVEFRIKKYPNAKSYS